MTDPASCCDLRVRDLWRVIVVWEVVSLSAVKRIDVIMIDRLLCGGGCLDGEIKERPVGWGIASYGRGLHWWWVDFVSGGEERSGVVCRSKG